MRRIPFAILIIAALSVLFAWAPMAWAVVHPVDVNAADFPATPTIDNPFFPLPVGTNFVYEGTKDGIATHDEMCVTRRTKLINGVTTRIVHHTSREAGVLVEDTSDYFAQDRFGNVWYFGEDTIEFPSGSTEGSWRAGVNDADAGFVMLANPQVGDRYYQEFLRNVAEDQAAVVSLTESICLTSGACYDNVLLTKETTRLEPGVVEYKYYAPNGVGFILGVTAKGGAERSELVSVGKCRE
jgi:hypothetical protein